MLDEDRTDEVRQALSKGEVLVTSQLTLIECDRTLVGSVARQRISEAKATQLSAVLARASSDWTVLAMEGSILERARMSFPCEPIRTLDALHLATALEGRRAIPDLALLSFDRRIREAGQALGFELVL